MNLPLNNLLRIKILDLARGTDQLKVYQQYLKNQYQYSTEEIIRYQQSHFERIFRHHFNNNESYRNFLIANGYKATASVRVSEVPLITKDFFRSPSHTPIVKEEVHLTKYSGGTTGVPLPVHLSKGAVDSFWPSIWRAFDVYKVAPCDKVMMMAGPSLFNNRSLKRKVYDFVNRFTVVSAFDLSTDKLQEACDLIERHNIRVIYGYTSAILIFLQYLEKNDITIALKCIFTTSETFIPSVRPLAEKYCGCDVVDTYGANDGGIFGFECEHHTGYHLSFERCLVEIIDHEIICTDFLNTAAPFIRYKVGDCTGDNTLTTAPCSCGRTLFRINDISGKVNEFIEDVDQVKIHCGFFTQLFKTDHAIRQYQVHQKGDRLTINIVHDHRENEHQFKEKYEASISRRFKIPFELVFNQPIETLPNMKTAILIKHT